MCTQTTIGAGLELNIIITEDGSNGDPKRVNVCINVFQCVGVPVCLATAVARGTACLHLITHHASRITHHAAGHCTWRHTGINMACTHLNANAWRVASQSRPYHTAMAKSSFGVLLRLCHTHFIPRQQQLQVARTVPRASVSSSVSSSVSPSSVNTSNCRNVSFLLFLSDSLFAMDSRLNVW